MRTFENSWVNVDVLCCSSDTVTNDFIGDVAGDFNGGVAVSFELTTSLSNKSIKDDFFDCLLRPAVAAV